MNNDHASGSVSLKPLTVGRRRLGALLGGVSAAALASGMPGASWAEMPNLAGTKLVFASWGGIYQNTQKAAFCDPFAKATKATIIQDGPVDYAKFRVMVKSGSPTWDALDVEAAFLLAGAPDDLFEKIDTKIVDVSRLEPKYVNEYGAGTIVWSYTLGYSLTTYTESNRPRSWADLFDVKKFPGRRMLRDRAVPMLEIALLADGVPMDKLYPLDVDRAFRKLDTVRKDAVFWTTNSQCQQLLADGEVTMGVINNGRLFDLVQKGLKLGIEWNQSLQAVDYLVVAKGSKNVAAAMALINYSTLPEVQAHIANAMANSPTNPAAFALIEEKVKPWMSTNPAYAKISGLINEAYWRDNLKDLTERWTKWKLG
jgi:putative spermidine/putrescine transport system substrate-binding protein